MGVRLLSRLVSALFERYSAAETFPVSTRSFHRFRTPISSYCETSREREIGHADFLALVDERRAAQ